MKEGKQDETYDFVAKIVIIGDSIKLLLPIVITEEL